MVELSKKAAVRSATIAASEAVCVKILQAEESITARESDIAERRKLTPALPKAWRDRFPHRLGKGGVSAKRH